MVRTLLLSLGLIASSLVQPAAADAMRIGLWGYLPYASLYGQPAGSVYDLPPDFLTKGGSFTLPGETVLVGQPYTDSQTPINQPVGIIVDILPPGQWVTPFEIGLSGTATGSIGTNAMTYNRGGGYTVTFDRVGIENFPHVHDPYMPWDTTDRPQSYKDAVANWSNLGNISVPPELKDMFLHPERIHVTAQVTGGYRNIMSVTLTIDPPPAPSPVPEPSALAVLAAGLTVLVGLRARAARRCADAV
jgi:hypothetical protein